VQNRTSVRRGTKVPLGRRTVEQVAELLACAGLGRIDRGVRGCEPAPTETASTDLSFNLRSMRRPEPGREMFGRGLTRRAVAGRVCGPASSRSGAPRHHGVVAGTKGESWACTLWRRGRHKCARTPRATAKRFQQDRLPTPPRSNEQEKTRPAPRERARTLSSRRTSERAAAGPTLEVGASRAVFSDGEAVSRGVWGGWRGGRR